MSTEHTALSPWIFSSNLRHIKTQLEPWTAPIDPQNLIAETFTGEFFTIYGCGKSNNRIGMQVINMIKGDKSVHRCIDTRRCAGCTEAAVIKESDHLIFKFNAPIDIFQCLKLFKFKSCKS